jgi:DNA repair exonuclease SbcCD ATPase subunit
MSASDRKKRRGPGKAASGGEQPPSLSDVAGGLETEVGRLEGITARVARLELNGERNLQRAAELLGQAAESHERFLSRLRALVDTVESAKQRHNHAADTLARCTSDLEARHRQYQALQERFGALASEARDVIGLMQGGVDEEGPDPDGPVERLRAASLRLRATAEAAGLLGVDAREANFLDLERQADAVRQQLHALSRKLQRAEQAADPATAKGQG